jgi:hypothetical protein
MHHASVRLHDAGRDHDCVPVCRVGVRMRVGGFFLPL